MQEVLRNAEHSGLPQNPLYGRVTCECCGDYVDIDLSDIVNLGKTENKNDNFSAKLLGEVKLSKSGHVNDMPQPRPTQYTRYLAWAQLIAGIILTPLCLVVIFITS